MNCPHLESLARIDMFSLKDLVYSVYPGSVFPYSFLSILYVFLIELSYVRYLFLSGEFFTASLGCLPYSLNYYSLSLIVYRNLFCRKPLSAPVLLQLSHFTSFGCRAPKIVSLETNTAQMLNDFT
jgi:hypothetical protein